MLRLNTSVKEHQLIRDCKHKKSKAQKAVYDKYASLMLVVCARYINDRMEAEHVMVGGMVKVFEKIGQFQEQGSFEGWIRRIMVNESLMYLRKNKNMSLESDFEEVIEEPNYDELTQAVAADELLRLIEELPVGYRTVFNLYAIEGYKHEEVGKLLGISTGTSKSQLNRARKLLQKQLVQIENEVSLLRGAN
ncbi:MAG: sigma-70 family RNA polymerase sigma factor [Cytophagales bacterium]|nr:sigma-70 family RNA polymerase sigma factor [Cytophagales bacterium]